MAIGVDSRSRVSMKVSSHSSQRRWKIIDKGNMNYELQTVRHPAQSLDIVSMTLASASQSSNLQVRFRRVSSVIEYILQQRSSVLTADGVAIMDHR